VEYETLAAEKKTHDAVKKVNDLIMFKKIDYILVNIKKM